MEKIITIDGPSGSGKSSIAKLLANRLGFTYLDTGAIYRGITYYLLQEDVTPQSPELSDALKKIKISISEESMTLNGEQVEAVIRGEEITKKVPLYAQVPSIRSFAKKIQQNIGQSGNIVVDGRDIGTVVFPDAFCKFYLDASPNIRAERRLHDEKEKNDGKSLQDIKQELKSRDSQDINRKISPLKIPIDAHYIDSSKLSIEEVIDELIEYYNKQIQFYNSSTSGTEDEFMNALENLDEKEDTFGKGKFLKATILEIKKNQILLDVNRKKDAIIPAEEALLIKDDVKVGQEINILVKDFVSGDAIVSKLEADKQEGLVEIQFAFNENKTMPGKVVRVINGGYEVDINNNICFCPGSQFDIKRVLNKEEKVGLEDNFNIISCDGNQVVVSRKKGLEAKQEGVKKEFFSRVEIGDAFDCEVVNVKHNYALLQIRDNGVIAILFKDNVAWEHIGSVAEVLKLGQVVKARVIEFDRENQKLKVSKKEMEIDPFETFVATHKIGELVDGTVKQIKDFGAFVEISSHIEGLLHISELSWIKKIEHPREVLNKNDQIKVKILGIDKEKRKVSLSYRETQSNPWDNIESLFSIGQLLDGTIKGVNDYGVECLLNDNLEGIVSIETIPAESQPLNEHYKIGENLKLRVKDINSKRRRIYLALVDESMKPWDYLVKTHKIGSHIKGNVKSSNENGLDVALIDDVVGFCHKSQIGEKSPAEGDTIDFIIQNIDENNQKIYLSITEYMNHQKGGSISKYLNSNNEDAENITLGDLIK